jgi:hypothetical protein
LGGACEELHDALRYLLNRTEQLSQENGALKMQLLDAGPPDSAQIASHNTAAAGAGRSPHRHGALQQHNSPCSKNSKGAGSPHHARIAANSYRRMAAAEADGQSDDEGGSEGGSQFGGSSSIMTGDGSMADREDLSSAASEELAAAQAAAAAECARRRMQRRAAAAAAAKHGSNDCYNTHHSSPCRNALNALQRSSSLESRETGVSDISSCSTLSPGPEERAAAAGYGKCSRAAGATTRSSNSAGPKASGGSNSRQLLETVLASYPNNRLGKLMQELVAAAGNAGTSAAAVAAASASMAGSAGKRGHVGSATGAGVASAALAKEQLRRLAQLSPGRQRLLRALAAADSK